MTCVLLRLGIACTTARLTCGAACVQLRAQHLLRSCRPCMHADERSQRGHADTDLDLGGGGRTQQVVRAGLAGLLGGAGHEAEQVGREGEAEDHEARALHGRQDLRSAQQKRW